MVGYEPRGKVKLLADAMAADPQRIWTSPEAAQVMEVHQGALTAHLDSAIRNGAIFRRLVNGRCQYSLKPFAAVDALEIPKFTGVAPQMKAPREGTDVRLPSRAPGTPPAPAGTAAPAPTAPPAPTPAPTPAATSAPTPAPAPEETTVPGLDEALEAETEEDDEPDAFISCRTGEVVLVGLDPDEEGRITIPADLVTAIRSRLAWSPLR